jgi:HAMP domain-containing protein
MVEEILDLMSQGNALKIVIASLRKEVGELNDVLIKILEVLTPFQRYVMRRAFSDDLVIESTVQRETDQIKDLERQILNLMGEKIPKTQDSVVAVEGSVRDFMSWSRPCLDQFIALLKGRVRVYSRHLENLIKLKDVYQHALDMILEPVQ